MSIDVGDTDLAGMPQPFALWSAQDEESGSLA